MQLTEHLLRQTQAANTIARALNYVPESAETPQETIDRAVQQAGQMSDDQLDILNSMLSIAESISVLDTPTPTATSMGAEDDGDDIDDEMSDEDLDKMIVDINDIDDIIHLYNDDEFEIVDTETGEVIPLPEDPIKESMELNEVLSRIERMKSRIRFARTASKRERKIKIALKKHSTSDVIANRARRLAISTIKTKLAKGRPLASLPVSEKARIERIVQKKSKLVGRLALKLTSRVRTIERDRLSK